MAAGCGGTGGYSHRHVPVRSGLHGDAVVRADEAADAQQAARALRRYSSVGTGSIDGAGNLAQVLIPPREAADVALNLLG
jgi:hypothetical protein